MKMTALVTGGTGGIGLACAVELQARGWQVYTLSRRAEGPFQNRHLSADVGDEAACMAAVGRMAAETGKIDLLINCAGFGISGAAEYTPQAEAEAQLRVNLLGTANMCRAVIPVMRVQGGGQIVNVSSVAAVAPLPFQAWYSVSKAAVNSYSMSLHNEVSRFGISVCCVMPGDTATGFTNMRRKTAVGDDVYGGIILRSVAKMEKDERNGVPAETVAKAVCRAALRKRVRPLYTVGWDYRLLAGLAKILPSGWKQWILKKMYAE